MLLEHLKKYSIENEIQLYGKKDELGMLYILIRHIIVEWEKSIRKGITTRVPVYIEERTLELATRFIRVHHFSRQREEKAAYLQSLSSWSIDIAESYFQKRMDELGATKEDLLTTIIDGKSSTEEDCFSCDLKTGNIEILITSLDGQLIYYEKEEQQKLYKLKRLAKPKGSAKYLLPKSGGTYPFFPEPLKQHYKAKKPIDILYITEGAFKAFKGCLHGMAVIGLSSITHYRDAKSTKQKPRLHEDIIKLIEVCQVKQVVILWDGDCRNIDKKNLELEQELSKRPKGFFEAVKKTRDLIKSAKLEHYPKVYFGTIRTENIDDRPKGLDDLLILMQKQSDQKLRATIKKALSLESKDNPYFYFCHISNNSETLCEYFCLNDAKQFYNKHVELIGEKEFIYKGDRYRYSETKNELDLLQPQFLQDLRWIGDDFFQLVDVPIPSKGDKLLTMKKLQKVMKSTLKDLYGRGFMRFMRGMHYIGFCNVPNHFNYQFEIPTESGKYYNKYFPFEHEPEKGNCDSILMFIRHIFGEQYEMGLDYLELLLIKPTQKLPVICFYSPENSTGKSIFGALLCNIFKNNIVFINNDDLKSEFGLDRFADKLVAICDETLLERKKDVERIKYVSTAEEALMINPKGMSAYLLHTYVKLIFNSNNLRMIHASENDERFWVIRTYKPKHKDPDLLEKMKLETNAFVHFLKHRKLSTEKKGRMWFDPELIRTATLEQVVRVNEHGDVQELRRKLEDYFIDFPYEQQLMLSTKDIIDELMQGKSRAWIEEILSNRLGVCKYMKGGKTAVKRGYIMKRIERFGSSTGEYEDKKISKSPQRVWVFPRESFVSEQVSYEDEQEGEITQDFLDSIHKKMN